MSEKFLPDEILNVWHQLVKSIFWQRLMTASPGQSVSPSTAVDTIERGVGIASEFSADGLARQSKLSGDGSLIDTFTTPLFNVELFFLSQMFSLHTTGSLVWPER